MTAGDFGFTITFPTNVNLTGATLVMNLRKPDKTELPITSCIFSTANANAQLGIAGYISWAVAAGQLSAAGDYTAQFVATQGTIFKYTSNAFTFAVDPVI